MSLKQEILYCCKYHKVTLIFWLPDIATYHLRNKECKNCKYFPINS